MKVLVTQLCPTLCDLMDITYQAPLFMEFSRQEHWSGLPFPSPGTLSDLGTATLQVDSYQQSHQGSRIISYIFLVIALALYKNAYFIVYIFH